MALQEIDARIRKFTQRNLDIMRHMRLVKFGYLEYSVVQRDAMIADLALEYENNEEMIVDLMDQKYDESSTVWMRKSINDLSKTLADVITF